MLLLSYQTSGVGVFLRGSDGAGGVAALRPLQSSESDVSPCEARGVEGSEVLAPGLGAPQVRVGNPRPAPAPRTGLASSSLTVLGGIIMPGPRPAQFVQKTHYVGITTSSLY